MSGRFLDCDLRGLLKKSLSDWEVVLELISNVCMGIRISINGIHATYPNVSVLSKVRE